ncbi:hypothetical protein AN958_08604 [Leucoagaricus sp. SymC.cos]|nr:hypothetical protein AN958_08604 [Leucoagaricus sp. SymC.cos]
MFGNIRRRLFSTVGWSRQLVNPYGNNPTRKSQVEQAVTNFAKTSKLEARGADEAEILSTEHVGGSNPNEPNHVTVAFRDSAGNHITTRHVPV